MRGSMHTEDLPSGKQQIIITEIPYNANRATLVTRIADLVKEKILDGVSDLRDESTETTRIVVELKMGEIERVTMNKLYKLTAMESSFGVDFVGTGQTKARAAQYQGSIGVLYRAQKRSNPSAHSVSTQKGGRSSPHSRRLQDCPG